MSVISRVTIIIYSPCTLQVRRNYNSCFTLSWKETIFRLVSGSMYSSINVLLGHCINLFLNQCIPRSLYFWITVFLDKSIHFYSFLFITMYFYVNIILGSLYSGITVGLFLDQLLSLDHCIPRSMYSWINVFLNQCIPGSMYSWINVFPDQCIPWSMYFLVNVFPGQCIPGQCIPGSMYFWINVFLDHFISGSVYRTIPYRYISLTCIQYLHTHQSGNNRGQFRCMHFQFLQWQMTGFFIRKVREDNKFPRITMDTKHRYHD